MMHGPEEGESCGLRYELPFGMVSETSEEYICGQSGPGTSGTSGSGDLRRVWFEITEMEGAENHIHILVSFSPRRFIGEVVRI